MLKYKFRNVNQDSYRDLMVPTLGLEGKDETDESIIKDPQEFKAIIDAYHAQEESFTWNITNDGSIINVSIQNDNSDQTGYSYNFDYNKLKELSTTNTLWCIDKNSLDIISRSENRTGNVEQSDFVNMFNTSYESQVKKWSDYTAAYDLKFYTPKTQCPIEDLIIVIPKPLSWSQPVHPQLNPAEVNPEIMGDTTVNVTGDVVYIDNDIDSYEDLLPQITATSTVSDGFITVTVTTDASFDSLILTPEVGYLPKTKLNLTNGVGSFNVGTLGLETGDVVSVKISTQWWSNLYRFTQTIA